VSVLLIRLGGLGDLLVALPAMACLRRAMPGRRFALLCRGAYGGLFVDGGIADEVIPLESREASSLFGEAGASPKSRARDFSLAVGWMQKPPPSTIGDSLRSLGIPAVLFSPPDPPSAEPLSRRFFADTLAAFPGPGRKIPDFDDCSRLRSERGGMTAARALLGQEMPRNGRFSVIHPGSGGAAKLWPFENFLEIARRLREAGIPGAFATGEAEECLAIAGRLERETLPPGWTWMRHPPLLGLAGLLSEGPLYLGNDSGITHLAAACGARVTALFLEKNIPAWEPFGKSRVLVANALSHLDTEFVWATLRRGGDIL
jgi:heptosyltransferase III